MMGRGGGKGCEKTGEHIRIQLGSRLARYLFLTRFSTSRTVEAPLWQCMAFSKLGNVSTSSAPSFFSEDCSANKSLGFASTRDSSPPAGPLIHAWRTMNPPMDAAPVGDEDEDEDDEWIAELDSLLLIDERIRATPPPIRPAQVPPIFLPGSSGPSSPLVMSPKLVLPKKLAQAVMLKLSSAMPERAVGCYIPTPAAASSPQMQAPLCYVGPAHSSPTPPPRGVLSEGDSSSASGMKRRLSIGSAPSKRPRSDYCHPGDAAAFLV